LPEKAGIGGKAIQVSVRLSSDRLGRSTAAVAAALEGLNNAGVPIYTDKEAMDTSTPHGRAMLQMAAVFAELERATIRERVIAGMARARKAGKVFGRPKVSVSRCRLDGSGSLCAVAHYRIDRR
jgi:DNA invertase Pin-like site-specific DNA recombinase